jgi:predicted metal-dependent phosphoesterase TrpH
LTFDFMIDLHLHTTVSDGRCTPRELVERARDAGISVMAVTDHDTVAGVAEVRAHAEANGMLAIAGIEITAVEQERDVHVLGYFFDPEHHALAQFLAAQRATRIERVRAIGERLASLGMPVDLGPVLAEGHLRSGRSIGRPKVARAMIDAGYVATTREAFDKWLGRGCPAFVARSGAAVEDVIGIVHRAGGLVSLAHPGRTQMDGRIGSLAASGLDALEVYHSDHDPAAVARYAAIAGDLGLLTTGGSDYHGDPSQGIEPAGTSLPPEDWTRLYDARDRHAGR